MKLKQVQGAIILVMLLALSFAPLSSQGSLSDQVLRLLDRENTWTKKQIIAANYGIQFNAGGPTVTTNKLYNLGGTLYWSGSPVAGGAAVNYFTLSGTTLSTDPVTLKLRLGSAGAASTLLHVDGTASVTGATTLASVAVLGGATVGTTLGVTGASTLASVGVTGAATVGTTLNVTGTTTLAGLGVNGAAGFSTVLGVTGVATFSSGAIFGNNTGTALGTIRWTGTAFEGYGGAGWAELGSAVSAGGWTEASGTNTVHLTTGTRKVSIGAGTTAPAFLGILGTTEQVRLAYDATHYTKFTVAAGGNLTFDSIDGTGSANAFAFSDPVTINGNLDLVKAAQQLSIGYDGSNYYTTSVSATGNATFNAVGAGAGFTFSDAATINGNLDILKTTRQLQLAYDVGNYEDTTVSSAGVVTRNAVGASSAFVFSDPMTINGNVDIVNATQQVRIGPDTSTNYVSVTVGATGLTTLDANGAGAAFALSDNTSVAGTFSATGAITTGGASAGELRVLEPSAGGTEYLSLKAPALAATVTWILPNADGTVGQVLSTNGSGTLAWAANAASGMSNPMTITGQIIYASTTASPSTASALNIGTTGQCLVVAGGLPAWGSCAAAATAAGSDTQVQYNNAGAFGANSGMTWVAPTLTLGGSTTGAKLGLQVTNTSTGSASYAAIQLGNDLGVDTVTVRVNSSYFTNYSNHANLVNKRGPWIIKATDTEAMTLTNTGVTIPGTLGVTGVITGSITGSSGSTTGNAATVTNGVYTTGSYANPAWITSLAASKVGLGSVENTALSTWAGSGYITTSGALNSGSITSGFGAINIGADSLTGGSIASGSQTTHLRYAASPSETQVVMGYGTDEDNSEDFMFKGGGDAIHGGNTQTKNLYVQDVGDPPDLALRRIGPNGASPHAPSTSWTAVLNGENIGALYWQTWKGASGWGGDNERNAEIRTYAVGTQATGQAGGNLMFYTSTSGTNSRTSAMCIGDDQNVGIGDPLKTQTCYGLGRRLWVVGADNGSDNSALFVENAGHTLLLRIRNDNYAYINAAAWAYNSDRRNKENILYFDDSGVSGLNVMTQLRPATFDYIGTSFQDQKGFIAQDVQPVISGAVILDDTTQRLSLKTDFILPYVVKSIQELDARDHAYESRIAALEARLSAFEVRH